MPLTGVATLMLDILSQLQCGGREEAEGAGATSLLLVGPPGVGQQLNFRLAILGVPRSDAPRPCASRNGLECTTGCSDCSSPPILFFLGIIVSSRKPEKKASSIGTIGMDVYLYTGKACVAAKQCCIHRPEAALQAKPPCCETWSAFWPTS